MIQSVLLTTFRKGVELARIVQKNLGDLLNGWLVLHSTSTKEGVCGGPEINKGEQLRVKLRLRVPLEVTLRRWQVSSSAVRTFDRHDGCLRQGPELSRRERYNQKLRCLTGIESVCLRTRYTASQCTKPLPCKVLGRWRRRLEQIKQSWSRRVLLDLEMHQCFATQRSVDHHESKGGPLRRREHLYEPNSESHFSFSELTIPRAVLLSNASSPSSRE